jgi:dipeptidyl-peptidase-4
MKRNKILFTVLFIGFAAHSISIFGGDKKKLNVEWLFESKIQDKLSVPSFTWQNNNTVLLLDFRKDKNTRVLEIFNPQNRQRHPAFDRAKILQEFKELCGPKAPAYIVWPEAVDPTGKTVIFVIDGDLFMIEFGSSKVLQLTKTVPSESSAAFSPDGRWVSFIRNGDLFAFNLEARQEIQLTNGATDTLLNGPLSWVYWEEIFNHTSVPYAWSPDSKAIAYLQTDDSEVSISTFVNFKPATQGVVKQRYPKAGQKNPAVKLGVVEVSTSKTTWIDCGKYEYIARFHWLRNGEKIAVQTLNRKQSVLKLLFADRFSGKSQPILVDRQPAWINLNDSLYFLKDGKRFIWLSERNGYQHLYLYRMDGSLIKQLTDGDFHVRSALGRLVDENAGLAGVDEINGWVYFTADKGSLRERHLFRTTLDGSEPELLSQENGIHSAVFSPDMHFYLEVFSNSTTPPSLTLHTAEGKKVASIADTDRNLLDQYEMSFPEFLTFKTADGLELPAMLTKPLEFDPTKKYPAVIYVYGGPGSQQVVDRWPRFMSWKGLLAQEGFFEVTLEVRAGMGKSKALETSGYRHAYGNQNVEDILAGVRWLKSLPNIDPENIGIWGWSGGGCTTLSTITHTDVFKAAIAVAPVSDWHFYDTIYTERYLSTPQENPEGYEETSSVLAAGNLKTKLLIVHGTYDDNVHPQNTFAFIDRLIAHNIPFEMMIYPWRKHGISDLEARIHLYSRMLDFWKNNLKSR